MEKVPRYSIQEKELVRKNLKLESRDCLGLYGVRRTSVDELVARVNIPKGTFYLFYPSKEELLYEVICDYIIELHSKFYESASSIGKLTWNSFSEIAFSIFEEASKSFLVQVAKNNEMEYLFRKLPENKVRENEKQIEDISGQVVNYLPVEGSQKLYELLSSFKILFYSSLNINEVGEDLYYKSLRMLLNGIALQFLDREN